MQQEIPQAVDRLGCRPGIMRYFVISSMASIDATRRLPTRRSRDVEPRLGAAGREMAELLIASNSAANACRLHAITMIWPNGPRIVAAADWSPFPPKGQEMQNLQNYRHVIHGTARHASHREPPQSRRV